MQPDYGKAHTRLTLIGYFLKDYGGAVEAYESALLHDLDGIHYVYSYVTTVTFVVPVPLMFLS